MDRLYPRPKRTEGYESYDVGEGLKDISRESITPKQVRATIAFLLLFVVLIAYGIITKQGSNYVLVVMVLLAAVLAFFPELSWRPLFPV